jgi:hypothetical protein
MPFTFLLGLGVFAVCILFLVDVDKSRIECRKYLEAEAAKLYDIKESQESLGGQAGGDGAETGDEVDEKDQPGVRH